MGAFVDAVVELNELPEFMVSSNAKARMLKRAAADISSGMTVNLGIGLRTEVLQYVSPGTPVCLHSENGIAGVGPVLCPENADRNLIDAGGAYVSIIPGTAFFNSAVSFAIVRSGRLDLSLLGAFQVAANGDLANWKIPGKFSPGMGGDRTGTESSSGGRCHDAHRQQGRSEDPASMH
ncbi:CoA-transferase [Rhizobium leguminosarum]|uniref:CoA-transferase n=1 Tax=Rhizobium leguminosarum TaxID=384 RepID=UPI001FEFBF56|nr:CoA-transferase [Rhizobium leguminosarum]